MKILRSMTIRRRLLLALAALLACRARPAQAHAILVSSSPELGAKVRVGRIAVVLAFNTRIDRVRSRLTLFDAADRASVLAIQPDDNPAVLRAEATAAAPGAWRLRWQVLSADGHITRGDVAFTAEAA